MSLRDLPEGVSIGEQDWNQTPDVVLRLMIAQFEMIQQLQRQVQELKARVDQNSSNSNRPPSSDLPYKKGKKSRDCRGRPGAVKGHKGHHSRLLEPTQVVHVLPKPCQCGADAYEATTPYYTHQQIEIPEIQMEVKHFILNCGTLNKATIPDGCRYGLGPRLTAFVGELSGSLRVSRSSVQEFLSSVFDIDVSRGIIQKSVDRVSEAIEPHHEVIAEKTRRAKVNHVDETSWYQVPARCLGLALGNGQRLDGIVQGAGEPEQGGI